MFTTFVTGGTGFVGATVIDQLLAKNHKIVAAVRSRSSGQKLIDANPDWDNTRITLVETPDFSVPGTFDTVFKEHPKIDYIIHVAAPLMPENADFVEDFEKPGVQGSLSILEAAKKFGKNVKAVAVTGSINAITTGADEEVKGRTLDSTQWLPLGRDEAIASNHPFIMYCVAKKLSEQAMWKFIEEEKPQFTLSVFNPPLLFAPMLQSVKSADTANFSMALIYSIINSAKSETGTVPNTMFPGYIDVRDLVELHIASLCNPGAANKRFVVGFPIKFDNLADSLRKVPELEGRIGKNNNEERAVPKYDISDADKVFGIKWRTLDETMADSARSLLKYEQSA